MKHSKTPPISAVHFKKTNNMPDYGTAERWQHSGRILELTDQAGLCAARALDGDILDRLVLKGVITARHRDSALRFRSDFQDAGMGAHLVSSYNPVRSGFSVFGGWDERSDAQEEAYTRWRKGVQAMGPMFSDFVISIVCYDETPAEQRLVLLTAGLVNLTKWYEKTGGLHNHVEEAPAREIAARRGGSGVELLN